MEVMRPRRLRTFREDEAALVTQVSSILIAHCLQATPYAAQQRWVGERDRDVENRLRREPGNGRATDMFDPSYRIAQSGPEGCRFRIELVRPPRVVLDDHGGTAL